MEGDDYNLNVLDSLSTLPKENLESLIDSTYVDASDEFMSEVNNDFKYTYRKPVHHYTYGDFTVPEVDDSADVTKERKKVIQRMGESEGPWPSWANDWPWWLKTIFTM